MPVKKLTWLGYMESISAKKYNPAELNIRAIKSAYSINRCFKGVFLHSNPMMYLLDYTSGKYMIMGKSSRITLGYDCKEFIDTGLDFTLGIYQKDDLKIFNENIFPDRLQILKQIPHLEHPNYIFSYNYRMRNNKGSYINLLQRSCFIQSDETRRPLLSLGIVINIENFKEQNPVIQLVEKSNMDTGYNSSELILKRAYYLKEEDKVFTKREKEILGWLTDGLTTKEIANKLYLSNDTVINHTKNMRLKSNSKNVAELIGFSFKNHIL